ncbi:MAG: signal peptidase I [Haliscomenobacter sp.]|nr:signal peptidase I [Haliscomenobacter sp.]
MNFWLFILGLYLLMSVGLYPVFKKAGQAPWKALVPGLNFAVWCQLIGRKGLHALWLLFPIVNIFIFAGMAIDLARSFLKFGFGESVLAVVAAPFYFGYLGLNAKDKYHGPVLQQERQFKEQYLQAQKDGNTRLLTKLNQENPYKKGALREWVEAVIFAVFAAAFIRMFLIEAYVIPTPSMEGSLLVGDFLFVSKAHYGIRMPQTVAMIPLLHNRIPMFNRESYLKKPSLDYQRLKPLEQIDHNDPVVFNYPEGDSVYVFPGRTWSIYDFRRGIPDPMVNAAIQSGQKPLTTRPMDKKDHYIKRCIGLPGDSLEVREQKVYINGKQTRQPKYVQHHYTLTSAGGPINTRNFVKWGISEDDLRENAGDRMLLILDEGQKSRIQQMDPGIKIESFPYSQLYSSPTHLFPHDPTHFGNWKLDNYGPIYIPKKGQTVKLTPETIALYRRVIQVYEKNTLEERNGTYQINGKETDRYTFKQNYFWMMGDNRHNSEDSRYWGFVPEDHIVGKPLFIWFSSHNGIRWNRIFTSADKK